MKKVMIELGVSASAIGLLMFTSGIAAPSKYPDCKALNKDFKHGVGLEDALDQTKGDPVTKFVVDEAVYKANKKLDKDNDDIACEKL
jgi:Excalibur calcium-binding domain